MLNTLETGIDYYANKFSYKFVKEEDSWYSIYRYNDYTSRYDKMIQSKDLEHCKGYCEMIEPKTVPLIQL